MMMKEKSRWIAEGYRVAAHQNGPTAIPFPQR
jgi:hypothetical protein